MNKQEMAAADPLVPQQTDPVQKPKRQKFGMNRRRNIAGTLFAMSPLLGFFLFSCIPMVLSLYMSLGEMKTFDIFDIEMIGFDNYVFIFTEDPLFFKSILNSFVYSITTVLLRTIFALLIAMLLRSIPRGSKLISAILFIPFVCSVIATSVMWKWVFDYNYGVLNDLMDIFGLPRVDWLHETETAMGVIIVQTVWGNLGFGIILYTAAFAAINRSYIEAAMIDGANRFRMFFSIEFPMISPTTFYLIVMGFIGALQSFANFLVMTPNGGPDFSTLTMVYHVYNSAFGYLNFDYGMGYASALSWVVGIIVILFTAANFWLEKKWVNYDV